MPVLLQTSEIFFDTVLLGVTTNEKRKSYEPKRVGVNGTGEPMQGTALLS